MAIVLLVEDDAAIRAVLTEGLERLGHVVRAVSRGGDAIALLKASVPDVMVLDLGLPDVDGANVLAISRLTAPVPVIVATARDSEDDVIRLLNAGADDYIVKPFSAAQIDARVRAVLRRLQAPPSEDPSLSIGGLRLDPRRRTVQLDGASVTLSPKEFELLHALIQRPGEVVTKQQLLADVWGLPWGSTDRTVDVHLSWLRRKLGESAAEPRYVVSVRGVGVKLVDPAEPR